MTSFEPELDGGEPADTPSPTDTGPERHSPEERASEEHEADGAEQEAEEKPPLALDVKIASPSACQRHVTVTISREDIDRYFQDAVSELAPKASVPGFRPGRAPRRLVESRFREDVTGQIKGALLMDSMAQISEEHEFSAINEPDIDLEAIVVPEEGPMTFEFDLEVRPEFDLPQWQGLQLQRPRRDFTAEDVELRLRDALSRYGMLVPQDEPAEANDYVVMDVTCEYQERAISEANELTVCVRPTVSFRDANLPGFDRLIIGARAGDVRRTEVQVSPDAPNEVVRGANVELVMTVLEVKKLVLPELDEKFLQRIGGFESQGDLLDAVRHDLERQLAYYQQRSVRQQITSLLTESANWELPPELLRRQAQRELDRAVMELRSSGFTDEQIQAHSNLLRQNSQASTATALKEHFILERIAEEEELEAEPSDYDREIALIADQAGDSPRSVRARYEKRGLMDALRNQIIERKAIQLITSQATFADVEYQLPRDDVSAVDHAVGGEREHIPEAKHGEARTLSEPADRS